jgi:hypothetical protein
MACPSMPASACTVCCCCWCIAVHSCTHTCMAVCARAPKRRRGPGDSYWRLVRWLPDPAPATADQQLHVSEHSRDTTVVLDENEEAAGLQYCDVGCTAVSGCPATMQGACGLAGGQHALPTC